MSTPDNGFSNPQVEAARRWLARYQPFIVTVAAIALIAILLPGRNNQSSQNAASDISSGAPQAAAAAAGPATTGVTNSTAGGPTNVAVAPVQTHVLSVAEARKRGVALEPNCDLAKGLVKIPSWGAPPCTQAFTGNNGGHTWQGVTDKKIVVAAYIAQPDQAVKLILTAAGDADTHEQEVQQAKEWAQLYEATFNTWGRKVEIHVVDGSGPADDDGAARADAIKVAKQIKAFASWGSPNNTYVNEVTARGVMCFCTVELPNSFYTRWAPYVWSTLQSADHTGVLLEEYLVKRMNNRKAQWAGQADLKLKNRVFGLLQYETRDYAYKAGTERFIKELLSKFGIKLKVFYYNGYPEPLTTNQEQARPAIQLMKAAHVSTIICGCDPFAPIFFTQEATNQQYFPEWFVVGSALTDTTFFGRTYSKEQWKNAFGFGQLVARLPEHLGDNYHLYNWYYHKDPTAKAEYGVIRAPIDIFYRGVHAAGPVLTPKTFQAGLFAQPEVAGGKKTTIAVGFGLKYPVSQWTAFHDMTEIWWDPTVEGKDEVGGAHGVGMWRYVNGGKRYLPGQIPSGSPKMFDLNGAITTYNSYPPGEAPPSYASPKR
jgi:hypothetical protein